MIDRTEINRALAKAIAYAEAGKHAEAADWGFDVIHALDRAGILNCCATTIGPALGLMVERPNRALHRQPGSV